LAIHSAASGRHVGDLGAPLLVAVGTQQVGLERGVYIGHSPGAGGRPIRYDPTTPSREARTSAVLAGTLGSGKTVAAQLVALAAERRCSLVVDFDPKSDQGLHHIAELEGRVDALELSGDPEHRGKLDPLRLGLHRLRRRARGAPLLRDRARYRLRRDRPGADRALVASARRSRACQADRGEPVTPAPSRQLKRDSEMPLRVTVRLRVLDPEAARDLRERQLAAIARLLRRAAASRAPAPSRDGPEDRRVCGR
jgi:hypothetical protein